MIIRAATPGDAAAIADFWNPQIRDTTITFATAEKTPDEIAQMIKVRQAGGHAYIIAQNGDDMLGFATYTQFRAGPGYAHTMEHSVIVDPKAWGRGVGRALMAKLEEHARRKTVHSLIACVSPENTAGLAFHENIGFERIAVIPEAGRKFDRWMDIIILQKLL